MASYFSRLIGLLFIVLCISCPSLGADQTIVKLTVSEICIEADDSVKRLGYTVNGDKNLEKVIVSYNDVVVIDVPSLPAGMELKTTFIESGSEHLGHPVTLGGFPPDVAVSIPIHLSLVGTPINPPVNPTPDNPSVTPDIPSTPDTPDVPDVPDVPDIPDTPENPDTPGSDEPGSDEPYLPILPPAGSVYNFAGFIPLAAGFLLLFLAFFWRRKVYRILKSHAKKHGEKPEKEHLKEIADAIIKLVRDEGRYPEWKKNSDVAKRLSADIVSVLDEMNYPKAVPRGALVAEIIKAARGKINRYRL